MAHIDKASQEDYIQTWFQAQKIRHHIFKHDIQVHTWNTVFETFSVGAWSTLLKSRWKWVNIWCLFKVLSRPEWNIKRGSAPRHLADIDSAVLTVHLDAFLLGSGGKMHIWSEYKKHQKVNCYMEEFDTNAEFSVHCGVSFVKVRKQFLNNNEYVEILFFSHKIS